MACRPAFALMTAWLLIVALPALATAQRFELPAKLRDLEQTARRDSNDAAAHYNRLPFARRPGLYQEEAWGSVPDDWKPIVEEADRHYRQAFLLDPFCDVRTVGAALPENAILVGGRAEFAPEFIRDYLRGLSSLLEGDYDRAYVGLQREESDKLFLLPLQANEFRYVLALIEDHAGKPDEARRLYQEVLTNDVGLYMTNVQLARLHENAREWDLAIRERQAAVNANPGDPGLLYDLAVTHARGSRWLDAEQTLTAAVEADARDTRALYYLRVVPATPNKPAEARQAVERFVALAPSRYATQIADAKRRLNALP